MPIDFNQVPASFGLANCEVIVVRRKEPPKLNTPVPTSQQPLTNYSSVEQMPQPTDATGSRLFSHVFRYYTYLKLITIN